MLDLENSKPCNCSLCEQGRFIKRVQSLLPEAEANDLSDWYNAMIDSEENRSMLMFQIEKHVKQIQLHLQELSNPKSHENKIIL